MYEVILQATHLNTNDASEALQTAVVSGANGVGSTILDVNREPLWEIEVDTNGDGSDPFHPVIVHFRGHSLETASALGVPIAAPFKTRRPTASGSDKS
jgi:hypothetical protein